ncbi:beta-lactamase family protein, partial [Streptomyces flavofungini]
EGAVQDDERQPFVPASLKDVGKFGRLGGQNTDGFAKVTAGGGLGDARIASQAVHTGVIAEPAQHEDCLAEGAQGSRALRRADLSSTGAQKPGQILDDTVDRWLPGVIDGNGNNGRNITLRQLLQNTSGLHDDLPGFDTPQEYYRHRYDTYTPEQIVARSMKHHPDFPPGTGWSYSNTGYVLLGMIAEESAGRPWPEQAENRILKPLGMNHTYLSGAASTLRRPHAHGYQVFAAGERTDVTEQIVPDLGGYVSTTADVNRFFQGLLGGELLSEARMAEMRDTVPVDKRLEAIWPGGGYGLGFVKRPLSCGGRYWSHQGGEAGFITLNGATDDGSRTVTVSMTTSFNDSDRTLRQQKDASDLVDRALCDTSGERQGK